uniref:Uncharacterized protein n=2 Tax=Caenorhabditis japonica TaxID=281687 RepID=A0A8R1IJM5_CAEJA
MFQPTIEFEVDYYFSRSHTARFQANMESFPAAVLPNVRKVSQESNAESVQSIPRPAEIVVTSPTNEPAVPTPAPKLSRFPVTESADPIAATPTVTPMITSVPVVESNVSVVVPPVTSTASTHLATPSPVSHSFSSNSSPSATTHSNKSSIQSTNSVPGRRFTVQPVSQAESGISSSISTPHLESSGHTGPPPVPSVPPVVSTASLNLEVVQTLIQLTSGDLQQSSSTALTATLVSDTSVEDAVPSKEQPVVQSDVLTQLESELRKSQIMDLNIHRRIGSGTLRNLTLRNWVV